jgi:hypothetical protein
MALLAVSYAGTFDGPSPVLRMKRRLAFDLKRLKSIRVVPPASRGSAVGRQLALLAGGFLAQVLLPGGIDADDVAVGDKERNHDLEASFELRLLPGGV